MRLTSKVIFFFLISLAYFLFISSQGCQPTGTTISDDGKATFVGSSTCKSCHVEEYKDWTRSDHYLAMQPANDSTVLGDFNNTTLIADGVTNRFFKKDGKFYINTQGEDGDNHDYEVVYTFGYYPLQQYLIAFPGGRFQSARVSWDARDKKWFHQYESQKIHHHDWLHWTGNSQNWNTMCASCHSTNLQKNYDFTSDAYKTTWNEINVSCESCHGPGSLHADFVQSSDYKKGRQLKNSGFVYGSDTISQLQLNTCAPCHARKSTISKDMIHSDEIMDDLIPQVISNDHYFPDGQIDDENFEYGSFSQSLMFHKNIRCSSCHNPHSGKLKLEGNSLCLSCHAPKYDTKEHHFHADKTEGSQCVNCHMTSKTFMGIDHRRDHSFRIPRPDQSVLFGTPNACTNCHQDKSADWATDAIVLWYGPARKYHFSDDLVPGSLLNEQSELHLIKLLGDTTQPEIARATSAYYLGNLQTQGSVNALMSALHDQKVLVRYHVLRSLENFPPELWIHQASFLLSDKVRAVRIAAADLFHRLPPEAIPASAKVSYERADRENRDFLLYQTDFSAGNVMLADYELQGGDDVNAIIHYLRGLEKDSLMNYARINLSAAYNRLGKNQEALKTLLEAATIDPFNDHIFYTLGLLYYELGDIPSAQLNFQKAVKLGSMNPALYYNYGLLLQQQGKMKEAEQILLKGFDLNPRATNINYALSYYYMQNKQAQKAIKHAEILHRLDPQNPQYRELFQNLGLL